MRVAETVRIAVPAATVWRVLADVTRWPDWNTAMLEVTPLDGRDLRVGARFRVRQPRLPVTVYTVDEVVDGRSFSWTSGTRLAWGRGTHEVTPVDDGSCDVELAITQEGLAAPVGWLMVSLIRRYVATEAVGLRARSES